MVALILTICFVGATVFAFSQADTLKPKKDTRPVKVSLLGNYYDQDGDHSAVNGGSGSQELFSNTAESAIYIPVKDSSGIKIDGGFDYFTAASMRTIDKYKTAASTGTSNVSGDELRTYAHIGFDIADKKHRSMLSPSFGFSKEYDVTSLNAGLSWSKNLKKRHGNYVVGMSFIGDRWMMVYPGEFRAATTGYTSGASPYTTGASTDTTGSGSTSGGSGGSSGIIGQDAVLKDSEGSGSGSTSGNTSGNTSGEPTTGSETGSGSAGSGSEYEEVALPNAVVIPVTGKTIEKDGKVYPLDWRYSLSLSNGYSYVVNKRSNAAVGLDLVAQWGMLSTPFHRVYFNDGVTEEFDKEVRIEKLPELRVKAALYARYNFAVSPYLKLRTYARYYYDTWDIHGLSATVETPVKATNWLTVTPFYRAYAQQKSKYFAAYGEHRFEQGSYYTSDYDLSSFLSHKVGMSVSVAPLKPIAGVKSKKTPGKYLFAFKSAGVRYSHYSRTDGLSSESVTFELNFEL